MSDWTAEQVAELFHLNYERLAPSHGYETREATAVPWSEVKDPNRGLMIEVAGDVLAAITPASNEGECPHIVTSDEGTSYCRLAEGGAKPNPNAAEGLRLLDDYETVLRHAIIHLGGGTERQRNDFIYWCFLHLRPILAAAADRGAAE